MLRKIAIALAAASLLGPADALALGRGGFGGGFHSGFAGHGFVGRGFRPGFRRHGIGLGIGLGLAQPGTTFTCKNDSKSDVVARPTLP